MLFRTTVSIIYLIFGFSYSLWGMGFSPFTDAVKNNDYYHTKEFLTHTSHESMTAFIASPVYNLTHLLLPTAFDNPQRKIAIPDPRLLRLLINLGIDCSENVFRETSGILPEDKYAGISPYQYDPSLVKVYLLAGVNSEMLLAIEQIWPKNSLLYAIAHDDYAAAEIIVKDLVQRSQAKKIPLQHLVDKKDELHATPLIYAATQGHLALVKLLLQHNADPLATTLWGHTVFDLILEHLLNPNLDPVYKENLIQIYKQCDFFLAKKRTGLFHRPGKRWSMLQKDPQKPLLDILPKDLLRHVHSFLTPVSANALRTFIASSSKPTSLPIYEDPFLSGIISSNTQHNLVVIKGLPITIEQTTPVQIAEFISQEKTRRLKTWILKPAIITIVLAIVTASLYNRIMIMYNLSRLAYYFGLYIFYALTSKQDQLPTDSTEQNNKTQEVVISVPQA